MCPLVGITGRHTWAGASPAGYQQLQPAQLLLPLEKTLCPPATSSFPSSLHLDSSPFLPLLWPSSHLGPTTSQTIVQDK